MNKTFWQDRKVLITGHTGFKGSWLTLLLNTLGANICGYSLVPSTKPSLFEVAQINEICDSYYGDIRDSDLFQSVVTKFQPEIVFHLAAQPFVGASYRDPVETFSTNVMGLINVLECLRKTQSVKHIVNVTSDKCYENKEWPWGYRETDPMGGFDPYSSSKGCAELVTASWRRSFLGPAGISLASGRAGNVIGGGDWANDRLIPDFVRSVTVGEQLIIRNPRATRPWQHVLEPLSGYVKLAEELAASPERAADAWNFGPDKQSIRDVEWLAETICKLWGDGASFRMSGNYAYHEAHTLILDSAKARTILNWRSCWTVNEALKRVVAWHKSFNFGGNARKLCLNDIEDYAAAQQAFE